MIRLEVRPFGNGQFYDVTGLLLGRYKRQSARVGGDVAASSMFDVVNQSEGELWLEQFLGYEFRERIGGETVFYGQLDSVTVQLGGVTVQRSLSGVFNDVRVRYQTGAGAAETLTAAVSDEASRGSFGKRELIYDAKVYLSSSEAADLGSRILQRSKRPRAVTVGVGGSNVGRVKVGFSGYSELLRVQYHNDVATSSEAIDAAIRRAVGSATYVEVGRVESNSATVSREVGNRSIWERVTALADMSDSDSGLYRVGCFGRPAVDYELVGRRVQYELDALGGGEVILFDKEGRVVNPALVKAGSLIWARDVMVGRSVGNPLVNDPRAILIEGIVYEGGKARISGGGGEVLVLAGVEMAFS